MILDSMVVVQTIASASASATSMTGPHAGEQTDAVLDRLGYSADAVAALRERGVVA